MTQIRQTVADTPNGDSMLRLDRGGEALDGTVWLVVEAIDKDNIRLAEEHDTKDGACQAACAASVLKKGLIARVAQATFTPTGNPGESRLVELAWMPGRYVNGILKMPKSVQA